MTRPIFYIQTLLRQLSDVDPRILPLIPSGIYDGSTQAAVRSFQSAYGLPKTGTIDQQTWDAVTSAHQQARPTFLPPPSPILWPLELVLRPDDDHPHLYLAQAMLTVLAGFYAGLQPPAISGRLDPATEAGLRWLQRAADLPVTGRLDLAGWQYLLGLYRVSVATDMKKEAAVETAASVN